MGERIETDVGFVPGALCPNRETPPKLALACWPTRVMCAHTMGMFEGRDRLISCFCQEERSSFLL